MTAASAGANAAIIACLAVVADQDHRRRLHADDDAYIASYSAHWSPPWRWYDFAFLGVVVLGVVVISLAPLLIMP